MKTIGIIAEYNPFHLGHLHHICESKRAVGEDSAIVCVMSGDFVQRGDTAVFAKHVRAEAAVHSGVDLVLELPLPWSLSSAEGFAHGAVGIFDDLGGIDYLSFGSESGDLNTLGTLAKALMEAELMSNITKELKSGVSFASARQTVLLREYGDIAEQLKSPNNILAVEYLKAIYDLRSTMEPLTITRHGAGHDESGGSAADIRRRLHQKKPVGDYVPRGVSEIFWREVSAGRGPVFKEDLDAAIISRLRMLDETEFNAIPDAAEGLGNRLFAASRTEGTLDGIFAAAKTKRYAMSRIRRMYMCAALGLREGDAAGNAPYARVLAVGKNGREVLKQLSTKTRIPILTKPAAVNDLSEECKRIFELGSRAHDLYVLSYRTKAERRGGGDYRTSAAVVL